MDCLGTVCAYIDRLGRSINARLIRREQIARDVHVPPPEIRGRLGGKYATFVTIRQPWYYTTALLSTKFLSSTLLETARTAFRATAVDLKILRDKGLSPMVKLPICESIIKRMRVGKSWQAIDIDSRMIYLGYISSFD